MPQHMTPRPRSWPACSARTSGSSRAPATQSGTPAPTASGLGSRMRFEILRDPIWNNIRVDELTLRLIDTDTFQRLRYVRQLGLAYLVYPGATHTRFEHAVGTYHLARGTLATMVEREGLGATSADEPAVIRAAALLHDVGHYPFSHALEEIGQLHHEDVARPLITAGAVGELLSAGIDADAPQRVFELVSGTSRSPLQGLISGSLDLDKIEYLKRDAFMCGVPYGEIDVERLTNSLLVLDDPESGRPAIGVLEKGLSALESLLFAKYQMYRNVYWHHAVRSATAMYKRMVATALDRDPSSTGDVARFTDEGLLMHLDTPSLPPAGRMMLDGLRMRRLHKRAYECPAATLGEETGEWIASDYALTCRVED